MGVQSAKIDLKTIQMTKLKLKSKSSEIFMQ